MSALLQPWMQGELTSSLAAQCCIPCLHSNWTRDLQCHQFAPSLPMGMLSLHWVCSNR